VSLAHVGQTSQAIEELRAQIAPKANDSELAYFAQVCRQLDLSPFADQIVLIGRWDKRAQREVHRPQITVAGRRVLATRTGELRGIEGPVWSGPRDADGNLNWLDVWDNEDEPPYCARVLVHRAGWVVPANGTAKWSEMAQLDKEGDPVLMWKRMPSHMLGKVAESLALRRAFADVVSPAIVENYVPDAYHEIVDADTATVVDQATGELVAGVSGHGARGEPETAPVGLAHETPAPPATANAGDVEAQDTSARVPSAPPAFATDPQVRKLNIAMREAGITGDDRLAWASERIGRPVGSSKDLTRDEASRLIDLLDAGT
jgi:phage recombination protein Bet